MNSGNASTNNAAMIMIFLITGLMGQAVSGAEIDGE